MGVLRIFGIKDNCFATHAMEMPEVKMYLLFHFKGEGTEILSTESSEATFQTCRQIAILVRNKTYRQSDVLVKIPCLNINNF